MTDADVIGVARHVNNLYGRLPSRQGLAQRQSVAPRHYDIADDKGDVLLVLFEEGPRLISGGCRQDPVPLFCQQSANNYPYHLCVVYNQDRLFVHRFRLYPRL